MKKILIHIILLFSIKLLFSENYEGLKFNHLTIESGLSHSIVNSVIQDDMGFMWFGTADGLNRFDGYDFKLYKHIVNDSTSISGNVIRDIIKDSRGNLWIATDNGLNFYNTSNETFFHIHSVESNKNSLSSNFISSLYIDKSKYLFIGTRFNGLNILDLQSFYNTMYSNNKDELFIINANNNDNIGHFKINSIINDIISFDDKIFAGTDGQGVFVLYSDNKGDIVPYENYTTQNTKISNDYVYSFFKKDEQTMWIATAYGISQFNKQENSFLPFYFQSINNENISNHFKNILIDDNGAMLLSSVGNGLIIAQVDQIINNELQSGVNYYQYTYNQFNRNSISSNSLSTIFKDRSGIFWIGTTDNGVNKLDLHQKGFKHFKYVPSEIDNLNKNIVSAVYKDSSSNLWIGTYDAGLQLVDSISYSKNKFDKYMSFQQETFNQRPLRRDGVLSIEEDEKNNLFFGTWQGISYLPSKRRNSQSNEKKIFEMKMDGYDLFLPFWDIQISQDGYLFGATSMGLYKFKIIYGTDNEMSLKRVKYYSKSGEHGACIPNNSVWCIHEDSEGTIWIGTSKGVAGLMHDENNKEFFLTFSHSPSQNGTLSSNKIKSIYRDKNDYLWIGTEGGGLNKLDIKRKNTTFYAEKDGLSNNVIWGILPDDNGNLWLSTNKGLTRFTVKNGNCKIFDANDGLQSNEFKMGAYTKSFDGELIFGGINGITSFKPEKIKENNYMPPVIITAFKIYNKPVAVGEMSHGKKILENTISECEKIELNDKDKVFSIEFAALHFSSPMKNKYAYKLLGFDNDWIYTDADNRVATYTNLPPGKYKFMVKATNSDGIWNNYHNSILIVINAPFYRTNLFYAIMGVFLLIVIALLIKVYIDQINKDRTKLETERELLQNLMDNIPDTIYFKDLQSRFVRINIAQAKVLGIDSPEEAIGKSDFDFFESSHANIAFADEKEIIRTGKPLINKLESFKVASGQQRWYSATKIGLKNIKGEIAGLVGISRDITQRKEAEVLLQKAKIKAEEADRLKSAFLANMSHEIRTPMNSIIGFTELLLDLELNKDERKRYLNYIRSSGKTLLNLLNDIIDIAKIESGELKIKKTGCYINSICKEIYASLQEELNRLGKTRVTAELYISEKDSEKVQRVLTDPHRLRQILNNLMNNAVKFTDRGKIIIGYTLKDSLFIEFFVKDTGIGIEPEKIDLIFNRFGQVETGYTKNRDGAGLGLAISNKLANLLQGKMRVESEKDKGSTFYFTIPFIQETENKDILQEVNPLTDNYNWGSKTFLVVEDEEVNFRLLEVMLSKTKAKITRARNGKEACQLVIKDKKQFDIVLMDIQMPVMNGYDATREIRSFNQKIPILAITAYSFSIDLNKIVKAGCNDYISKPFTTKDLFLKVEKFI